MTLLKTIMAAVVPKGSAIPVWKEIPFTLPKTDEVTIKVLASGYHHLVKGRAMGAHYSVKSDSNEDAKIGVDGVGYIVDSNELVYFASAEPSFGSCATYVNVNKKFIASFPLGCGTEKAISSVAALTNGAMSSHLVFKDRIPNFQPGAKVAILGVTGTSGQIAIQVAKKIFGVVKVIGIGRSMESLTKLKLEQPLLDSIISLEQEDIEIMKSGELLDIDVVLDYTYGDPAMKIMTAALKNRKDVTQLLYWVQIGQMLGATISVPAAALRSRNFYLLGSGFGPITDLGMAELFQEITNYLAKGDVVGDYTDLPIEQIASVWDLPWSSSRICFKFPQ